MHGIHTADNSSSWTIITGSFRNSWHSSAMSSKVWPSIFANFVESRLCELSIRFLICFCPTRWSSVQFRWCILIERPGPKVLWQPGHLITFMRKAAKRTTREENPQATRIWTWELFVELVDISVYYILYYITQSSLWAQLYLWFPSWILYWWSYIWVHLKGINKMKLSINILDLR